MFDPQAARKRCEAATPGDWRVETFVSLFEIFDEHGSSIYNGKANREFIAHARSDLPAALEALEEAQGNRRWLAAALIHFFDHRDSGCAPMYGCCCGAWSAVEFAAGFLGESE
jgi:hypothetical protein